MKKLRSLQKVTSNRTDLKSINHLISIQSVTYKTKRQSMTKNALSFSTLFVVSLILNSSTTKYSFVSANPQSEKPVESEVNKGKFVARELSYNGNSILSVHCFFSSFRRRASKHLWSFSKLPDRQPASQQVLVLWRNGQLIGSNRAPIGSNRRKIERFVGSFFFF